MQALHKSAQQHKHAASEASHELVIAGFRREESIEQN